MGWVGGDGGDGGMGGGGGGKWEGVVKEFYTI